MKIRILFTALAAMAAVGFCSAQDEPETVSFEQKQLSAEAMAKASEGPTHEQPQPDPLAAIKAIQNVPDPLDGVVTVDEFREYLLFQHEMRTDPEIVKIEAEIQTLWPKLQALQEKLDAAREKARKKSPEFASIEVKIREAMMKAAPPSPPGAG